MDKQNLVGECLVQIQNMPRSDPRQAAGMGWALTRQMLDEVLELSELERRALAGSLTREESGLLFGIAFGGAVDAIRESTPQYVRDGLLALIIEEKKQDSRETLRHLCLLYQSATKLGTDLAEIFQPLRQHASSEMASLIEGWLSEGTKDIGAMGYAEGVTRDGRFTYVQTR